MLRFRETDHTDPRPPAQGLEMVPPAVYGRLIVPLTVSLTHPLIVSLTIPRHRA